MSVHNIMNPRSYRRIGTMTYEVSDNEGVFGTVWRTRNGWSAADLNGNVRVDDLLVSRDTAAGALRVYIREEGSES